MGAILNYEEMQKKYQSKKHSSTQSMILKQVALHIIFSKESNTSNCGLKFEETFSFSFNDIFRTMVKCEEMQEILTETGCTRVYNQ